jgi:hypothetical protein
MGVGKMTKIEEGVLTTLAFIFIFVGIVSMTMRTFNLTATQFPGEDLFRIWLYLFIYFIGFVVLLNLVFVRDNVDYLAKSVMVVFGSYAITFIMVMLLVVVL